MKKRRVIKSMLICVAIVILAAVALVGCSKDNTIQSTLDQVSDLVAVKVNNYMAQWNNPAFNSTHEGDNGLTVHVPKSTKLDVTDLIVSPGSTAMVYEDEKCTALVHHTDDISIESEKELFIRVTNNTNAAQSTDYKLTVFADIDNLSKNENIDNRGGHLIVSGDKTIISGAEYVVITSYGQLVALGNENNDLEKNYILGNDIKREGHTTPAEFRCLTGIFDGNNYQLNIGMNSYFVISNSGVIKNVILDDGDNASKSENTPTTETGFQFVKENSNQIKNCVNKNIIYRPNESYITVFAHSNSDIPLGFKIQTAIEECINYGDLWAIQLTGIGSAEIMKMCINIGDLTRIKSKIPDDFPFKDRAIGVSDGANELINCANLGNIIGGNFAAGIGVGIRGNVRRPISAIMYNINYGEVNSEVNAYGIAVSTQGGKEEIGNLNYGKIVGKQVYNTTDAMNKKEK